MDTRASDQLLISLVHPEAIWALSYTPQHLISGSSDGHLRIFDPSALAEPLYDIPSHPLAITSLSSTKDGKYALATSLDGTVVLVDVLNGTVVGKVETGREKATEGENGMSFAAALPFLEFCESDYNSATSYTSVARNRV